MLLETIVWQARKGEEQRAQRMAAEMNQYRHDMERRLTEKDEELESTKYDDIHPRYSPA